MSSFFSSIVDEEKESRLNNCSSQAPRICGRAVRVSPGLQSTQSTMSVGRPPPRVLAGCVLPLDLRSDSDSRRLRANDSEGVIYIALKEEIQDDVAVLGRRGPGKYCRLQTPASLSLTQTQAVSRPVPTLHLGEARQKGRGRGRGRSDSALQEVFTQASRPLLRTSADKPPPRILWRGKH